LDQRRLPSSSDDEEWAAQFQVWEAQNHASQLSPPVFGELTDGTQAQSLELTHLTGAEEVEPHRHSRATGGEQYSCKSCAKVFKRPQELARHIREVHDSPPKCPFCPHTCKRAYLMKRHLIKDHGEEFAEDILEGVLMLQGKDVFVFVETLDFLRTFEPPVTNASPYER
jgi:uncharacterized C2H2 Zn-finger protein